MGRKQQKKKKHAQKQKKKRADRDDMSELQTISSTDEHVAEASKNKAPAYTIDQLLEKAEECIDSFDYEVAQKFCQRALEMDADNTRALEMTGTLLLELGDTEAAKHCFGRAIEVCPDEGHSKYMYMGQLLVGAEAIQCFHKGIHLMTQQLEHTQKQQVASAGALPEAGGITKKDVSSAYCAIAEIYLTDACFEEGAEMECKGCLDKALNWDSENSEAYQLMASFLLSKEDKQHAKEMIEKGVSLWLPKLKEADQAEGGDLDPVVVSPVSYQARVNAAKLLTEVENFECAGEVLELLLDEDDEVVEVWYLLGWVNYLQGEDYKGNARYYLNKAKKVSAATKCKDQEVLKHVDDLLEELGPGEGDEEDEETADGGDDDGDDDMDFETDSEEESAETHDTMEH